MTPHEFQAIRKKLNLTRAQFATALGVSESSVNSYCAAARIIPKPVEIICGYLVGTNPATSVHRPG